MDQDKPSYIYIENEGALFRGPSPAWPRLVYDYDAGQFEPYTGDVPKPIGWGDRITEERFKEFVACHHKQKRQAQERQKGAK